MPKRITIKDIARELNIHHSTVSRALRGDKSVTEKTRKMVADFAKKHGYQINMSALHLRGSVRNVIAIVVPNINHNFFSNVVSIVTNLAFSKGYIVSVFQSNEKYKQEKEIIETLIQNNVAGVIASISMETVNSNHFKILQNYHIPLIMFDRICPELNVTKVTVNNFDVVREVTELLISRSFKRIAHISGTERLNVFRERQAGYKAAITKHQLDFCKIIIIDSDFNIEAGKAATEHLFVEQEKPDALICDSHMLTLGAIFKLRELENQLTQKVGLAGFSDNPYVAVTSPDVISIVQPDEAIAQAVFDLMIKKIELKDDDRVENMTFHAEIIE